jgi:hypothetical protein
MFVRLSSTLLQVRLYAVLLNFDPLRAIVLHDRLIILVPDGADSILDELQERLLSAYEVRLFVRLVNEFGCKTTKWSDVCVQMALQLASEAAEDNSDDNELYGVAISTFPLRAVEATLMTVLGNLEVRVRAYFLPQRVVLCDSGPCNDNKYL